MRHSFKTFLTIPLLIALSSCGSSAPSKADIQKVLDQQMAAQTSQLGIFGGLTSGMKITVLDDTCTAQENNEFNCAVTVNEVSPLGGGKKTTNMVFAKTKDGWTEVQ